jgi:hypothetical protein
VKYFFRVLLNETKPEFIEADLLGIHVADRQNDRGYFFSSRGLVPSA